jgi:hypothetical protein
VHSMRFLDRLMPLATDLSALRSDDA